MIGGYLQTSQPTKGSSVDWNTGSEEYEYSADCDSEQSVFNPMNSNETISKRDRVFRRITQDLMIHETLRPRRLSIFPRRYVGPDDIFKLHRVVAVGKFGAYYSGIERRNKIAKIFKIYHPQMLPCRSNHSELEKQILSLDNVPYVMPKLYMAFKFEFQNCLVLEDMRVKSLHEQLMFVRRFPPFTSRFFMIEIAIAVSFLHRKKIIHRNLTLDAFWIQSNGHLKLTDFSRCKKMKSRNMWRWARPTRLTNYTPPEILTGGRYTKEGDIWAMGIMMYRMMTGRMPFYSDSRSGLKKDIIRNRETYTDLFSLESVMFCSKLLQKYPYHRLAYQLDTFETIRADLYFKGVQWDLAVQGLLRAPEIPLLFPTDSYQDQPYNLDLQRRISTDSNYKPLRYEEIVTNKEEYELVCDKQLDTDSKVALDEFKKRQRSMSLMWSFFSPSTNMDAISSKACERSPSIEKQQFRHSIEGALKDFEHNMTHIGPEKALRKFKLRVDNRIDATEYTIEKIKQSMMLDKKAESKKVKFGINERNSAVDVESSSEVIQGKKSPSK